MKYWNILVITLVLFLGACTPKTAVTPVVETLSDVSLVTAEPISAVEEQPVLESEVLVTDGNLILTIFSPADNAIVTASPVEVCGTTNTETVMTINGLLFLLTANQEFSYPVDLEEGYNTIELVASDYEGNQVEMILTVIYEK
ncbi:MAG: hypothetical protein WBV22_08705 [Anaerolineaceae bacterium]